jgi:HPt (histidine-containing phosphotransfer) domain-containing protein
MERDLAAHEFDESALVELREDLGESFAEFVVQFIVTGQAALDEIDSAIAHGDGERASAQAHSLRGTAGYLGAVGMCRALGTLQHAAQNGAAQEQVRHHAAIAREAFIAVQTRGLLSP